MAKSKKRKPASQKVRRQRVSENVNWRPAFLAAFETTGVVLTAAAAVGISARHIHRERQNNPEFAAGYEEARVAGALLLEQEAVRRARDGVQKFKFYEGQMIMVPCPSGAMQTDADGLPIVDGFGRPVPVMIPYVEHEYSDALMMLLLKRNFPNEYRENSKVEHSGEVHATVQVLSEAEAAKLRDARRKYLARMNNEGANETASGI